MSAPHAERAQTLLQALFEAQENEGRPATSAALAELAESKGLELRDLTPPASEGYEHEVFRVYPKDGHGFGADTTLLVTSKSGALRSVSVVRELAVEHF